MSVGVADEFRWFVDHASRFQKDPAVSFEVVVTDNIVVFQALLEALCAKVFDPFQFGQLLPNGFEDIWILCTEPGQGIVVISKWR